jgi:quercetin dioxygenase-like cupin family protein
MQIQLQPGILQVMEIQEEEIFLQVGAGELWVTSEGQDYLLKTGERLQLPAGKVVWESLSGVATFCLAANSARFPIYERKRPSQPCA